VTEARLGDGVPQTAGWFVLGAPDARRLHNEMRGVGKEKGSALYPV
jgi:hypothetical protein